MAVYGACDRLVTFVPYRLTPLLPGESSLPFRPAWSAVYLSLNFLLLAGLWVLKDVRELLAFCLTLMAETLLAAVFFLLVPLAPLPPVTASGLFPLADSLNLTNNYFPSLHVTYALTAAGFYSGGLWWLWAGAVALSTLLLRQHYLVDLLGAVALSVFALRQLRPWARLEALCLLEFARCVRRHRRYLVIAIALYAARRPVLRYGFCWLQRVDDLLDGHLPCHGEPLEPVDELLAGFESGGGEPLGRALYARLSPEDRERVGALVREMRLDRLRVRDGEIWEEERLREHGRRTFRLSLDLMLSTGGCELRAADVPELVDLLAWCSTFRDLEDDLRLGLVNVPREYWEGGGAPFREHRVRGEASEGGFLQSAAFRDWRKSEFQRAEQLLREARFSLQMLRGRSGERVLRRFLDSVESFHKRTRAMTRQVGQS